MKISEWKKAIPVALNEELEKLDRKKNDIRQALEAVASYEKYKYLLQPKMLKKLRKWVKAGLEFQAFCLHGDQENVFCRYRGSWIVDYKGKVVDQDVDETSVDCEVHDDSTFMIYQIIDDVEMIDEFKEVVELLRKIEEGK